MTFGVKSMLQALVFISVLSYTVLLVYRNISSSEQEREVFRSPDYHYEDSTPTPSRAAKPVSAVPLEDIFIAVKTTQSNHKTRVPNILQTWYRLAPDQTWFFTDVDDPDLQNITNGHVINTKCYHSHHRKALCCKLSVEFDAYLASGKKWFCHMDDDNYLNVPRLQSFLGNYNSQEDWYLGKTSIRTPVYSKLGSFWFATGGAGVCLSRALALKMSPVAGMGRFMTIGDHTEFPDDVAMGYIIERLLKVPLTVVNQFHSHLEPLSIIPKETFHDQITLSNKGHNTVNITGFDKKFDPTRFLSIHCFLFPHFDFCQ